MKQTCFEKKLKNFLTQKIFDLDWHSRIAMRHPRSRPLSIHDPNRESPPSLITSKGKFLHLGPHCDAGTQSGLKVGKNFFRLKLSQSPETWEKPVLKKS